MRQFNAKTFVCFLDLSGFKRELKQDIVSAGKMLDIFYSAGYRALKIYTTLNGIFVSDCGIIYSDKGTPTERLKEIMLAVKDINVRMLQNNFLTTASIAYGYLEYKKKFVFDRIKKNQIMGSGYLNAFLDSEDNDNKIFAGQVRITKQREEFHPSKSIFDEIEFNNPIFKYLENKNSHYYYHWYLLKHTDKAVGNNVFTKFSIDENINKFDTLKTDLRKLSGISLEQY